MKQNMIKSKSLLIKGGIQYLRGKLLKNRKDKIKGATNYLRGRYL